MSRASNEGNDPYTTYFFFLPQTEVPKSLKRKIKDCSTSFEHLQVWERKQGIPGLIWSHPQSDPGWILDFRLALIWTKSRYFLSSPLPKARLRIRFPPDLTSEPAQMAHTDHENTAVPCPPGLEHAIRMTSTSEFPPISVTGLPIAIDL